MTTALRTQLQQQHGQSNTKKKKGTLLSLPLLNNNGTTIIICFLTLGILFVLFNALGAKLPSPHPTNNNNVGNLIMTTDSAAAAAAANEVKLNNPYSKLKSNASPNNRLAIIIPYLPPSDGAPTFPSYFDLFAMSAAGSSKDIDYLIFHCFIPPSLIPTNLPSNVKLIDLNINNSNSSSNGNSNNNEEECGLANLFTRVTDERQRDNKMQIPLPKLISRLSHQIINLPYILVEYKPAFGHIFHEYITQYSHWGYSDLDVVFGDMPRWIDRDEWDDYDIVTYGFGDQDKLYLRGQFTFHRNDPAYINQLWRHCTYLSEMDVRYSNNPDTTLKFESAEGCYSQAVITRKDIKVKWAVKAFTDVGENSPIYTHGVYLSLGSKPSLTSSLSYMPKSVLYTSSSSSSSRGQQQQQQLQSTPYNWFEDKSKYPKYLEANLPIQKLVGERRKVETYRTLYEGNKKKYKNELMDGIKCMYWAPKTYQLDICTVNGNVKSDEIVILEKGTLYKQKFVVRNKVFPEGIMSFPFFHFQEWKRIYRTTELLPSHNIRRTNTLSGLIITKEGALPLLLPSSTSSSWNFRHTSTSSSAWMDADTGSTPTNPSNNKFCLYSSPKGYPKAATVCKVTASWPQPGIDYTSTLLDDSASVTILRSPAIESVRSQTKVRGYRNKIHSSKKSTSWWDERIIDANNDVTLTLTLQITSAHMKEKTLVQSLLRIADSNIFIWGSNQPCVLLIQVDSSNEEEIDQFTQTVQLIKDTFAPPPNDVPSSSSVPHLKNTLVAIIDTYEPSVSRKGLLNMAMFAAPTRWIVSGLELERGLILSKEASIYATREAKVHADIPGHVWVIPQFASTKEDSSTRTNANANYRSIYSSVGAELLPTIRGKQTMTANLSEYDCIKCADNVAIEDDGNDDGVDDAAKPNRRRLMDLSKKNVENLLEDLWWDLSIADVYGTPGGFNGDAKASLGAMAKIHNNIEASLVSLLDLTDKHVEYLRYFDKSPILLIDRLGPKKEMMTLDLAPEVEDFGGGKCFHLLRLAQLATLGYKVSVLPGAFAASYPNTREALCTESFQKSIPLQQCDCDLDSEGTIKEILIDEVKKSAKVAVLINEINPQAVNSQ